MGNTLSADPDHVACNDPDDVWWNGRQGPGERLLESDREVFNVEFARKQQARKELLRLKSSEMSALRGELAECKEENERLRQRDPGLDARVKQLNSELCELREENKTLRESVANAQNELRSHEKQTMAFDEERRDYHNHVTSLKDVIGVSRKLLEIRETQLQQLKAKLVEIETSLGDRELSTLSTHLKDEYERQLRNIRALKILYEQRQHAASAEKDLLAAQLHEARTLLQRQTHNANELQERVIGLENDVSKKYDETKRLESQLGLTRAEYCGLEAEMAGINQLFSEILFRFNNSEEMDLDVLLRVLEENHALLTEIVQNEESEEMSAALPKVLLSLVQQVSGEGDTRPPQAAGASSGLNSAQAIGAQLPKVWRVLRELLRQQSGCCQPTLAADCDRDPCYKAVQTPTGPKLVLSVSQTFIRLKDLILEKKSLEKETKRLKQLNTHLEVRLQDQETRLQSVSLEVKKTWHKVGRMQRQHQQLRAHESIVRYGLAQKRAMVGELRQELERCREQWAQARAQNCHAEAQWRQLRSEFAARRRPDRGFSDTGEGAIPATAPDGRFRREERLRRLEEQCQRLLQQVARTSSRGTQICQKLDALHQQYGPGDDCRS